MNNQHSSFNCTSADFEKAALQRFRCLVPFLSQDCRVYRETWETSTVVCLDFAKCSECLEDCCQRSDELIEAAQTLALGSAIIFRINHKFMGWKQ